MKTNQLALRIGVIIMILMAVFYLLFSYITDLNSPVFLRYCMDVEIPYVDNQSNYSNYFCLDYFTNTTERSNVVGISFPEVPELIFSASESFYQSGFMNYDSSGSAYGRKYGRYSYRTVYVYFNYLDQVEWSGEKVVHKANIQLNNGETHTVDIGTIVFYRDQRNLDQYIENISKQSSSYGLAEVEFQINPKIKVLSIKSDSLEIAEDISSFRINDYNYKDFPPKDYENKGIINVSYQVSGFNTPKGTFDYYDIRPKLYYEDPDGNIKYYRMVCNTDVRFFGKFWDVLLYLVGRGVI